MKIYQPLNSGKREIRLLVIEPPVRRILLPLAWGWSRVLRQPLADRSGPIRCRLEPVSLDEAPVYNALSYVWGDPNDTREIIVDEAPVQVTANLHAFLRHYRANAWRRRALPIWIDAVCINQADNVEKSHQIRLMRTVFAAAARVWMWVDEDEGVFKGVCHQMDLMKWGWRLYRILYDFLPLLDFLWPDRELLRRLARIVYVLELVRPPWLGTATRETRLEACRKFFAKPFWTRMWIVQEFVLASRGVVACGSKTRPLGDFLKARAALRLFNDSDPRQGGNETSRSLSSVARLFSSGGFEFYSSLREAFCGDEVRVDYYTNRSMQVLRLLYEDRPPGKVMEEKPALVEPSILDLAVSCQIHSLTATKQLDKIYALLGILVPEKVYIQPDYDKTTLQLHKDVVVGGIKQSGSLRCFSVGGIGLRDQRQAVQASFDREAEHRPSWVADIGKPLFPVYRLFSPTGHTPHTDASGSLSADFRFRLNDDILESSGFVVDRVARLIDISRSVEGAAERVVLPSHSWTDDMRNEWSAHRIIKACVGFLGGEIPPHPTGIPWLQVLFRTLFVSLSHVPRGSPDFHCAQCHQPFGTCVLGFLSYAKDAMTELGLPQKSTATTSNSHNNHSKSTAARAPAVAGARIGISAGTVLADPFNPLPWDDFGEREDAFNWLELRYEFEIETAPEIERARMTALAHMDVLRWCSRFFTTRGGYYGICRAVLLEGDLICVLPTCPVPVIVRPDGDGYYVLVGDCHIYGMMQGEMVPRIRAGEFTRQIFQFR